MRCLRNTHHHKLVVHIRAQASLSSLSSRTFACFAGPAISTSSGRATAPQRMAICWKVVGRCGHLLTKTRIRKQNEQSYSGFKLWWHRTCGVKTYELGNFLGQENLSPSAQHPLDMWWLHHLNIYFYIRLFPHTHSYIYICIKKDVSWFLKETEDPSNLRRLHLTTQGTDYAADDLGLKGHCCVQVYTDPATNSSCQNLC